MTPLIALSSVWRAVLSSTYQHYIMIRHTSNQFFFRMNAVTTLKRMQLLIHLITAVKSNSYSVNGPSGYNLQSILDTE